MYIIKYERRNIRISLPFYFKFLNPLIPCIENKKIIIIRLYNN